MSDIPEHVGYLGEVIKLGWVAPEADSSLTLRAAVTNIQDLRVKNGFPPLIPRDQIVEKDFISPLGKRCINYQASSGGCTGWSNAQAGTRVRLMRGQEFQKLSGAAIYSQINGGRDNGSNIIDSCNCIETTGTCLESEMDFPHIYSWQIPPGVLRFKEDPATKVTITSFDEALTALNMNLIPQFPLNATNAWVQNRGFDANGVANLSMSGSSNHSVHGALVVRIGSELFIGVPNSWKWWGPWVNANPPWYAAFLQRNNITPIDAQFPLAGCCLISEGHMNNCARDNDGFAHGVTLNAPSDTDAPGVLA